MSMLANCNVICNKYIIVQKMSKPGFGLYVKKNQEHFHFLTCDEIAEKYLFWK